MNRRYSNAEQKERIRQRVRVQIDEENYQFFPERKDPDYYDNDVNQRVGVYVRVSTDDPRQTTSYELQKKYYEDFVVRHPKWTLVDIYADEGISGTSTKHRDEFNRMIAECKAGKIEEHLTVTQFKVKCEQERLAQLQEAAVLAQAEVDRRNREATAAEKKAAQAKAKLNDVAPMLKGMEKLAEEFSSDPEQVLPEAGPLESARAYREKKAKPLWAKIVKVLRSVYRAYYDLKSKFERLQADYGREVSKNSTLSERIYEVCAERDSLKGKVRDYERVRRAIGPEQADRILEAAYQQEQAEKERKRAARQKARLGAR
ncbi:MAG: recombinase family protein [Anaerolineaceae bacterium]|nr:recombinase family protein [Anaerolineaceae bacterium]